MKSIKLKNVFSFIAVISGFFMALLDTTIVNISLPTMMEYFNTSMENISWVTNSYNISFIVLMLAAARLADQLGRKKLFIISLIAFTILSCLIGLTTNLQIIIVLRFLQGMAGAVIVPVTLPLIINLIPKEKIGMITGVWGAIGGLAAACGPVLGGILTQYFGWQAVFFINLPIGIIAINLVISLIKESVDKTASRYIDFPGIIFISITILTLTIGLLQAAQIGWNSMQIILLFIASFISLILFIIIELRSKDPMIPIKFFKHLPFSASSITLIFSTMGLMAGSFMIAFFLTKGMGFSQIEAGMTIIMMPVSMIITSIISGPVSQKIGSRIPGLLGMILISIAIFLFSQIGSNVSRAEIIIRLIILGSGIGMTIAPVMASAVQMVPKEKIGIASGITNFARTFGTVLGIVILASTFSQNYNFLFSLSSKALINDIENNSTFDYETKSLLVKELESVKFSKSNMVLNTDSLMSIIDQKTENKIISRENEKPVVSIADQKNELASIIKIAQIDNKNNIFLSFKKSFLFYFMLFIFGVIITIFIEPIKKKSENRLDKESLSIES